MPARWPKACAALLLLVVVCPVSVLAREAGWVPRETYKSPLQPGTTRAVVPPKASARAFKGKTVYERQPLVTEQELASFIALLPQFRSWARQTKEDAHPIVNAAGEPDFVFSARAADWVKKHGFEPNRFFCVMGRMAAGLSIIEEGNDLPGARPMDMPTVDPREINLARKHLGELLTAAGARAN